MIFSWLETTAFGWLFFFLPCQLGKHFWPDFAFLFGLPVDYLSPTLYLTDFLILLFLFVGFIRFGLPVFRPVKAHFFLPFLFFPLLFLKGVSFYCWLRFLEFAGLFFCLLCFKPNWSFLARGLAGALFLSSLLALGQFLSGGSLDGPLWWWGERHFSLFTPGIARQVLAGRLFLRAYATFPHPHLLAAFLLSGLLLLSRLKKFLAAGIWPAVSFFGFLALLATGSRLAWLLGIVFLVSRLWSRLSSRWLKAFLFAGGLSGFLGLFDLVSVSSFTRRWQLAQIAWSMWRASPWLGWGWGNFIPNLPAFWQGSEMVRFFQPAHNLFLLVFAEGGLMTGLFLFASLFIFCRRLILLGERWRWEIFILIFTFGFFDHFWFTLHQGQLLLVLLLALSWRDDFPSAVLK